MALPKQGPLAAPRPEPLAPPARRTMRRVDMPDGTFHFDDEPNHVPEGHHMSPGGSVHRTFVPYGIDPDADNSNARVTPAQREAWNQELERAWRRFRDSDSDSPPPLEHSSSSEQVVSPATVREQQRYAREGPDFVPRYPAHWRAGLFPEFPASAAKGPSPAAFKAPPPPAPKAPPPAPPPQGVDPMASYMRVQAKSVITPEFYSRLTLDQRRAVREDPRYVIQAHVGSQVDSPHVHRHTVEALKDYCRAWGISSTGIKRDLITRVEWEAVHGCPSSRGMA